MAKFVSRIKSGERFAAQFWHTGYNLDDEPTHTVEFMSHGKRAFVCSPRDAWDVAEVVQQANRAIQQYRTTALEFNQGAFSVRPLHVESKRVKAEGYDTDHAVDYMAGLFQFGKSVMVYNRREARFLESVAKEAHDIARDLDRGRSPDEVQYDRAHERGQTRERNGSPENDIKVRRGRRRR